MVGSSIMVFPIIFISGGIVTAFIIMLIIGLISMKTCLLEIEHFRPNEIDL